MDKINVSVLMQKLCPTWNEAISGLNITQQERIKKAISDYYLYGYLPVLQQPEKSMFIIFKAYINGELNIKSIQKGELHWNWKGGITSKNHKIRESKEYRQWIKAVFSRDNWICQKCGEKGGKLHAHHIKSFSKYPELRLVLSNGITYCNNCHRKWHKENGRGIK